jgi:hypothetical protein
MLSPWQDSTSTAGMSTWRRRPGVGPVAGRTAASQPEAWRRGRREPRVRPRSSRSSICPAAHLRRLLVPRSRKYAMSVTASPTATASSAAATNDRPAGNHRNYDVCDKNTSSHQPGNPSLSTAYRRPALPTHTDRSAATSGSLCSPAGWNRRTPRPGDDRADWTKTGAGSAAGVPSSTRAG